ncbi:unnamed protein product [Meloidogyne enterolobii]|uniref:Uncharacterized protein n=1 Tax=Meloidogyne enterolobii TaxID=390850 RepID=A0ACB1ASS6_MELEN
MSKRSNTGSHKSQLDQERARRHSLEAKYGHVLDLLNDACVLINAVISANEHDNELLADLAANLEKAKMGEADLGGQEQGKISKKGVGGQHQDLGKNEKKGVGCLDKNEKKGGGHGPSLGKLVGDNGGKTKGNGRTTCKHCKDVDGKESAISGSTESTSTALYEKVPSLENTSDDDAAGPST